MMANETQVWQAASEIYAEIAEMPVQEALQHLTTLTNITEDVRTAVLTLIQSSSNASQFFQENIASALPEQTTINIKSGDTIDEYQLLEPLGRGGMSQVFKARRLLDGPQKLVAIKIFAPRHNQQELLSRFLNEQKILAGFSHPNIVDMLHGGKTDDDTAYLVMELVQDARPLDDYCREKNISVKQKIRFISECADALSYSHSNLIIHRDLKPENILVNSENQLKIVDFGIAKLIDNETSDNKTTIMALTPSYAAPEQINSENITVRSDVFSLAVVMLTILIGESPFSTSRLMKSCSEDEKEISQALKKYEIDTDLKNILNRALKSDPRERYDSMSHFADDLNAWLEQRPVSATPDTLFYQISKFAKRRKSLFISLTALLSTMIVSMALLLWQNNKIRIEAEKARQVKEFMLNTFENTNPDISKGQKVSANDLLSAAAERIESNKSMNPEIRSELTESIGIAFGKLGLYDQSIEYLDKSLQITPEKEGALSYLAENYFNAQKYENLESLLQSSNPDTFHNDADKLRILQTKIRYLARNSHFEEAFETLEQIKKLSFKDIENQIAARRLLAEIYFYQSQPDKSIEILKKILSNPRLEKNQTLVFELRKELAEYQIQIGDYENALTGLQSLVIDQSSLLGNNHPSLLESLRVLSATLKDMSRFAEAQKVSERAFNISTENFGENSVQTGYVLNNLAVISHQLGDTQKAQDLLKRAVDIFDRELPAEYADSLELKSNYAATLYSNKNYSEALNIIKQVHQVQTKKLGKIHNQTLYTQKLWADTLGKLGHEAEAIELIDNTLAIAMSELGIDNPMTLNILYSQGIINQSYQHFEKASLSYKQIIETQSAQSSPLIRKAARRLALVLIPLGKNDEVISYFEKSIKLSDESLGRSHKVSLDSLAYYIDFLINNKQADMALIKLNDFKSRIQKEDTQRELQWQEFMKRI